MSGLVIEDRAGRRVATITLGRTLLQAAVALPVPVASVVTWSAAPSGAPWWPVPVLAVLALGSAALPDSGAPLVTLAALCAWWLVAVPEPGTAPTLAVATCAVVFHLAAALAAAGPPGIASPPDVAGRLALRAAVLLAVAAALALAATAAEHRSVPPPLVVAVTLLLAGALPWLADRS